MKAFSTKHEGNLSAPTVGRTDIMGPSPPILRNVSCEYNNSIMVEFNRPERYPDSLDMYYIDVFEGGVPFDQVQLDTAKQFLLYTVRNALSLYKKFLIFRYFFQYYFRNVTPNLHYDVQVYAASKSTRTGNLVKGEKSKFVTVFVSEGCYVPSEPFTELWAGVLAGFLCAVGFLLLGGGGYLIWK